MKNGQQYMIMTGAELLRDNGSGYNLLCGHEENEPFRRVRKTASYLVGWNGVTPDNSTLNHVEPISKVSRKWLAKYAPEILNYL